MHVVGETVLCTNNLFPPGIGHAIREMLQQIHQLNQQASALTKRTYVVAEPMAAGKKRGNHALMRYFEEINDEDNSVNLEQSPETLAWWYRCCRQNSKHQIAATKAWFVANA